MVLRSSGGPRSCARTTSRGNRGTPSEDSLPLVVVGTPPGFRSLARSQSSDLRRPFRDEASSGRPLHDAARAGCASCASVPDSSLDAALPCGRNSPRDSWVRARLGLVRSSRATSGTQPPSGASAQPSRRLTAYTEHGRGCVRITRSGTNFPFGWADVRGEISASAAHSLASSSLIRQPQPRPSPRPSPRASPRPLPEPCSCS